MTTKRTPRPRDPVQLGKLMVDIMTGHVPDAVDDGKDDEAKSDDAYKAPVASPKKANRKS